MGMYPVNPLSFSWPGRVASMARGFNRSNGLKPKIHHNDSIKERGLEQSDGMDVLQEIHFIFTQVMI